MSADDSQLQSRAGAMMTIDLGALVANWHAIGKEVTPALAGAVVKADAYGLGAVPVVQALAEAGCRHFFVAMLDEARALRRANILPANAALYILNGLMPGAEPACLETGAIPVLNTPDQIERWATLAHACGRRLPAIVQVDSGMSRLGLMPEEAEAFAARQDLLAAFNLHFIISHLACADEPDASANRDQPARFHRLAALFPGVPRALDNSAGALFHGGPHHDLVRPGIALYGGAKNMRPVISLTSRILQLRSISVGTGVGYGLSFVAQRPTLIATIPIGYADGWPRHLSGKGSAYIAGHRVPIAGRISMDSITLDVTDVPAALVYPDAPVELLGPHQGMEDVARDAGTVSYEILTRLGNRYARSYRASALADADIGRLRA